MHVLYFVDILINIESLSNDRCISYKTFLYERIHYIHSCLLHGELLNIDHIFKK